MNLKKKIINEAEQLGITPKELIESVAGWILLFGGLYIWTIILHAIIG